MAQQQNYLHIWKAAKQSYLCLEYVPCPDAYCYLIYQAQATNSLSINQKLTASEMSVWPLPKCLDDGLAYQMILRRYNLKDSRHGAVGAVGEGGIEEIRTWIRGVVDAAESRR